MTGHSIGNEENWGGVSWSGESLTVEANRDASSDTAKWFNRDLASSKMIGCHHPVDGEPAELHFAIGGTLSMPQLASISCSRLRIGQGKTNLILNNWWIGGDDCNKKDGVLVC